MADSQGQVWEFQSRLLYHCPSNAEFYFLVRYGIPPAIHRFPEQGAYKIRHPFQPPLAQGGRYLLFYCSDESGRRVVEPVNHTGPPLTILLTWPAEVGGSSSDPLTDPEVVKALDSSPARPMELSEEAEWRQAKLSYRRKKLALQLKQDEQQLVRTSGVSADLVEALHLNQGYRSELRQVDETIGRLNTANVEMMQKNLLLLGQIQEAIGKHATQAAELSAKLASPPPPPDYSPVIMSGFSMLRDIVVAGIQKDKPRRPRDEQPPVKAELAEKPPASDGASSALPSPLQTAGALASPASAPQGEPAAASKAEPTAGSKVEPAATAKADPPKAEPALPKGDLPTKAEPPTAAKGAESGVADSKAPQQSEQAPQITPPIAASPGATPSGTPEAAPVSSPSPLAGASMPEVLVNALAATLLSGTEQAAELPEPEVEEPPELPEVLVEPSNMDEETARRLLTEGDALAALAGLMFFHPGIKHMIRGRKVQKAKR